MFWILVLCVSSIMAIVLTQDIFQVFVPRSRVFNDKVLTIMHFSTCAILFIDFVILGISNFILYRINVKKRLPLSPFWGLFAGRSLSVAFVFLIEMVNIFVAYYWVDAIVRIIACVFSSAVVVMQVKYFNYMANIPSNETLQKLIDELEQIRKEKKEVEVELSKLKRKK